MSSPEISIIIVTLNEGAEILPLHSFESDSFDDYEVIIRRDKGISTARNQGIREASADKLLFIDDDAIPCENYLTIANRLLSEHMVVSGRVYQPDDAPFSHWELSHYEHGPEPKTIESLVGCNMAFQREVFEKVGYFDERFEWGHDETELADRINDKRSSVGDC